MPHEVAGAPYFDIRRDWVLAWVNGGQSFGEFIHNNKLDASVFSDWAKGYNGVQFTPDERWAINTRINVELQREMQRAARISAFDQAGGPTVDAGLPSDSGTPYRQQNFAGQAGSRRL
ncbi:hypothetical protein ACH4C6_36115 [Streptomyces sp. NPDC017943]|uniref:hypothetical protein n=1 Tax=Streptomyces sp. NPDC017943 TaxID=3365019 RepID=UPI0037B9FCBF